MTELSLTYVLIILVCMMLGLIELPLTRKKKETDREKFEIERAREQSSTEQSCAREVSMLRRRFQTRFL
jgi:hypothetical protein